MDKREYRIGIEVTDEQWDLLEPHLSDFVTFGRGGQKPADKRACFEAVLWMARSGARGKDLPRHFPVRIGETGKRLNVRKIGNSEDIKAMED